MAEAPLRPGARYVLKAGTRTVRAVRRVDRRRAWTCIALEEGPAPAQLALNDIGRVRLRTSAPIAVDPYAESRATGSFILIDEATNDTVAAGMVMAPSATRREAIRAAPT